MLRTLYTALWYAALPPGLPLYAVRNLLSGRGAGGVWSRLYLSGRPLPAAHPVVWLHAVSVGETLAAQPVWERLRAEVALTGVITTTTLTGQTLARKRLQADYFGYFPFDLPGACARALRQLTPCVVLYTETELWPNFILAAARAGVKQALINGRISDRSFAGYRRWRGLFAGALAALDWCAMQTPADAERLIALGARPERVTVVGNTKFDSIALLARRAPHPLTQGAPAYWVAGSTHPGEHEAVLNAHARLRANARLVICPRHPQRAGEVLAAVKARGWSGQLLSAGGAWRSEVLIIDTIGDLAGFYAPAQVVFLGGSFIPHGGQNMLEPMVFGVPVLYGPHTHNFRAAVALLEGHGGMTVADEEALVTVARALLKDPARRTACGIEGRALVLAQAGASASITARVREWL
ncbi:MAG TPA: 3-deoxy-D-manno-octulosonic acid transferase [bacterium]|nr:3-deoxy-D-manno-octulosonic acid transferase [bacterium]